MPTRAPACSHYGCRKPTRDATGRCHLHRSGSAPAAVKALPSPPRLAPKVPVPPVHQPGVEWADGYHPTGGYDELVTKDHSRLYTRHGKRHRTDGPAIVVFHPNGAVQRMEWWVGDEHHREDGPAYVYYDDQGNLTDEEWWLHGKAHREGGPSSFDTNNFGGRHDRREWWVRHGKRHRLDGPAFTTWHSGKVVTEEYAIEGVKLTAEEHAKASGAIADGAPLEWALAYALGDQG